MATINAGRTAQRAFPLKEWMNAKRSEFTRWLNTETKFFNKSFLQKIWTLQNFFISLQRLKYYRGTSAADSNRQFLYPQISENNITAPCRVCGNAPGSPAIETLATRSAVSYAKNSIIMATTINANQASGHSLPIKEWASKKNKSLTLWLNTETKFFTSLCGFPVTRLLTIQMHLLFLCMIITTCTIDKQPLAAAVSALCAAYLACRINKKKGGKA